MKPIKLTESDFEKINKDYLSYKKSGLLIKIRYVKEEKEWCYECSFPCPPCMEAFDEGFDSVENAIIGLNDSLKTIYTALSAKQEPCEVCKEVKNLWGSQYIDKNGYDYCPYCGRKLEEV